MSSKAGAAFSGHWRSTCWPVLGVLATMVALLAPVPARADEAAQTQAQALLKEMAAAPDFRAWFEQRRPTFTPDQAAGLDELALRALRADRHDLALNAAMLASMVHRQLRQPEAAVRSALTTVQLLFMRAESLEEYVNAQRTARSLVAEARRLELPAEAFQAAVMAAEAAHFGASAPQVPANRKDHPLAALTELKVAFEVMPEPPVRLWFERLVSLTAKVVERAQERLWLGQDDVDAALKALVPLVEARVPVDFAYSRPDIGDAAKSVGSARVLAALSYRVGRPAVGSARLAQASERARPLGSPELDIELLRARHEGEQRAGASPGALRPLRSAAWERAQALRGSYRSAAGRIWAAQRADALFGDLLRSELEDRGVPAAELFARVESLKARMLLDRLAAPDARELLDERSAVLARQVLAFARSRADAKDLFLQEMQLVSRLAGLESFDTDEQLDALAALETLHRPSTPAVGYGAPAEAVSLAALQQALAADEALVEYVIPPHALHPAQNLWALLVTRSTLRLAHVPLDKVLGVASVTGRMAIDGAAPLDTSALGNLIVGTRVAMRRADDAGARERLALLHRLLVQPLQAQGFDPAAFKRLLIVPHGVLHSVPFAALRDAQGRFLVEHTEVVVAPSASVWMRLASRRTVLTPSLVLANPRLDSRGVVELPFAQQEGQAVARTLGAGAALHTGNQATLARLLADAPRAGVLHLATHGEFPDESAASSHALWLADEGGRGVTLPAEQVRRLRLAQARLVVLSVCNGGLYRIGPSDEPYGLVPAFLEAGAANVVGTLWPLEDQFGRDFMAEYYRQLPRHGVAGALRQTALRFIGEGEYLRNWAAYALVGAGR